MEYIEKIKISGKSRYDVFRTNRKPEESLCVWASPEILSLPVFARVGLTTCFFDDYSIQHHNQVQPILELILEGNFQFRFQDEIMPLHPGDIGFFQRNTDCGFTAGKNGGRKLTLIFSGALLDTLIYQLKLQECRKLTLSDPGATEARFREIIRLLDQKTPGTEPLLSERVYSLFLHLSNEWSEGRNNNPKQVVLALEYIERMFQEPIRVQDIASTAGVCPSTLVRLFHKYLHTHPSLYLNKMRMEYAANLLLSDLALPVKEVAWQCGFSDPLYFSTAFRKHYHLSPRDFRSRKSE